MDGGAVAVAEYLKFDVARVAQIFFHIDGRVAKGRRCLARRLAHQAFKAVGVGHYLHAAAAAARGRLAELRIADVLGQALPPVAEGTRAGRTGEARSRVEIGKRVSERVELGGGRNVNKKKK